MGMDEAEREFVDWYKEAGKQECSPAQVFEAYKAGYRAATRWRKWTEEKPEREGTFLVTNGRGDVVVDHCLQAVPGGYWFWMFHPDTKAWQPLPAPYQPEVSDEAKK